jgi:hypothetical protein
LLQHWESARNRISYETDNRRNTKQRRRVGHEVGQRQSRQSDDNQQH